MKDGGWGQWNYEDPKIGYVKYRMVFVQNPTEIIEDRGCHMGKDVISATQFQVLNQDGNGCKVNSNKFRVKPKPESPHGCHTTAESLGAELFVSSKTEEQPGAAAGVAAAA